MIGWYNVGCSVGDFLDVRLMLDWYMFGFEVGIKWDVSVGAMLDV
jgi:hypothetical protein